MTVWWAKRFRALLRRAEERESMIAMAWSVNPLMFPMMTKKQIEKALDEFEKAIEADDHTMRRIIEDMAKEKP